MTEAQSVRVRCFDCGHEWSLTLTVLLDQIKLPIGEVEEPIICPKCGSQDVIDPETDALTRIGSPDASGHSP